ncbi:ABC transporter permease [Saccharothrix syringae]|uniref:Transport permease protein n=1 Tax=Saccharothrix syringae TaxID=103733 RepID=A0A5Q0GTF6_SACSY|nr:ABC transporter permease [Saccharothrix syringae]QFZ17337.1 ABC transporter permease [Saccharothrix syringae]
MNATLHGVRLGLERGLREFRHSLRSSDQFFTLFSSIGFLTVLWFQRDSRVEDTSLTLAALTLPSIIGMSVVFGGLVGPAGQLAVNREDGTLLRAKAVPNGMVGYLVGRVTQTSLDTAFAQLAFLVPGAFLVDVLAGVGAADLLALVAVLLLGMLATLPWGAVIGSIAKSPGSAMGMTMLPIMGVTAISGIFYPITAMPGWLQAVAQVFPMYWAGHGTRWALLPDAAAAAELGGTWRLPLAVVVLGTWAVVGFLVAPTILRRMARRESGSDMESRRQAALQRIS